MDEDGTIQSVLLSQFEFDYIDLMLDYGATIEQALQEVCPEIQHTNWCVSNITLVQKSSGKHSGTSYKGSC